MLPCLGNLNLRNIWAIHILIDFCVVKVIVERCIRERRLPLLDKTKFLVPHELTIGQFLCLLRWVISILVFADDKSKCAWRVVWNNLWNHMNCVYIASWCSACTVHNISKHLFAVCSFIVYWSDQTSVFLKWTYNKSLRASKNIYVFQSQGKSHIISNKSQ